MNASDSRSFRLPAQRAVGAILTLIALLWGSPGWAAPADNQVELFPEQNYGGKPEVVSLAEGESQRVCMQPYTRAISLKVGQKVGVLIQRSWNFRPEEGGPPEYPEYHVFTGEWASLPRRFANVYGEIIIFRRGNRVGVWPNGHPDGVTFSKHRSTTVLGSGLDSEMLFCGPSSAYGDSQRSTIQKRSLQWVTLYGKATNLKVFDSAGREVLSLTTKGEDWKDFDLSGSLILLKAMARFEVGIRKIEIVPGPGPVTGPSSADTRRYWVVAPGRYFLNTSGNTWDEFQNDRKAFSFTETRRTAEFVEFFDTSRSLWIRLYADRAMMLRKDDPSLQWQTLGPGKWSLEEPPKMKASGGPPTTPPGPPGSGLLPPVLPSSSPNLTGAWTSNFGMTYQIQQTGPNFTWTAVMLKESGQGKFLSKNEITAQWSSPIGSGSAKGKITQTDQAGKPTRIEWSHGIVFSRK